MTQGNFFTGTNAGGNGLEVTDGSTTNFDVNKIILGTGLSISSSLGRTVTIESSGGSGGIGGTIANTQVAYGDGANSIKGEAAFTYTEGTDTLSVGVVATTGAGVTVGGTGTITTNNGSISAGGASGSVVANTTVTGGTGVEAATGNVVASDGQVVAIGVPDGTIAGTGLVVAENSIIKGTFTDFTALGDINTEGGALLASQLGQSRWCSTAEVVINNAVGSIDLSLPENIGAQMQITASGGGLVIRAFTPTPSPLPGTPGTVTSVIGNAGVVTPAGGTPNAVEIAVPAFETVVLQVAGDLSDGTAFGSGALGTGVLLVLGKCTLTAI